ncbi:hypothetical protein DOY81_008261, partial [Sarcophaga bullata]
VSAVVRIRTVFLMVIKWFPSSVDDDLPRNIFEGGRNRDGSIIYVGRAFHQSVYLPAAIIPSKKCAKVSWNGHMYSKDNYELLVSDQFRWETFCEDNKKLYEKQAVSTDVTIFGEMIFVGRASIQGSLFIGRLQLSQNCLYVPFEHVELPVNRFEILIYDHERKNLDMVEESKFSSEKMLPEAEFQNIHVKAVMFEPPNYASTTSATTTDAPASISQSQPQTSAVPVPSATTALVSQTQPAPVPIADTWVLASPGDPPLKAVHAGYDIDKSLIFVARVFHAGSYIPAKAIPAHNAALIPHDGQEICRTIFEYLVGDNFKWLMFTAADTIPTNAVIANPLSSEGLCIGRTVHGGSLLCGKVVRSQRMLYVPFNYQEVPISPPFEILVRN